MIFLQHLECVLAEYDKGNKISFNRLGSNPATLRGFERGSRLHVAASFIAQRGGCTSSETPFESESSRYQSLIQEQLIESWARHEGCWVECTDEYLKNNYGKEIGSGSESHVYLSPDGTKVIKEWKTGHIKAKKNGNTILLYQIILLTINDFADPRTKEPVD